MWPTAVFPKNRFYSIKVGAVVCASHAMNRNSGVGVLAVRHAKPVLIGAHVTVFQHKLHVDFLIVYSFQNFPQSFGPYLGGHRIFHLVETAIAHVREDFM